MELREQGRVKVVNAGNLVGKQVDSATATGDLDLYPGDVTPPVYILTNNLSGAVNVGLNTRNVRRKDPITVTRTSGTPSANAITVKTGTAAAGGTVGTISASKNGHISAVFDGTDFVLVEKAEY